MPRQSWSLVGGRPIVDILLAAKSAPAPSKRRLLADTGAGSVSAGFEIILHGRDCLACAGIPCPPVTLAGAFAGTFPVYLLRIQIRPLGFDQHVRAVGARQIPGGLDGITCFRFLSRFNYGNFGSPREFGLEI